MLIKILHNLQENICVRVSFLIKLLASGLKLIKKETPTQVLSCEFWETFKNTFFTKYFCATTSDICFHIHVQTYYICVKRKKLCNCDSSMVFFFFFHYFFLLVTFSGQAVKSFFAKELLCCYPWHVWPRLDLFFFFFSFATGFWADCLKLFNKRFMINYQRRVWPRSDSFLGHSKKSFLERSLKSDPQVVIRDVCGTWHVLNTETSIHSIQKAQETARNSEQVS